MATTLPADPLAAGIADYGARLRAGSTSAGRCVGDYLARIRLLDGSLGAYRHVAADAALAAARDIDRQLAAGTDLGPLMGVPVALKDIIVVDGMPTTGGSRLDLSGLLGGEGSFVARLRASGCILLGKLATCEFALGSAGVNYLAGTPRNPRDAHVDRVPGGSSSGSAVAMAAGLCGFSIGTDTGGSVRTPAAFCGVFGMKPTRKHFALDGVLPMSRSLDSIGFLARCADDAALIQQALTGAQASPPAPLGGLRLARPRQFFDGVSGTVGATLDAAFAGLEAAGARFIDIDAPELDECAELFLAISGAELRDEIGAERFAAWRERMNPDVSRRIERGLRVQPCAYRQGLEHRRRLIERAASLFDSFDALLGPTKQHVAPALPAAYSQAEDEAMAALCAGPTRAANVMDLCAASLPLAAPRTGLPVGLQIVCGHGADAKLLSISRAVQSVLGRPKWSEMQSHFRSQPGADPGPAPRAGGPASI
jgi:aspartyl-tRNA(Asn)/glutamyl-tRNA(Gln) amidotransferase subunit A